MSAGLWIRFAHWATEGLARTWQLRVEGEECVARLRADHIPLVFAVWHGQLLPPLWHRRGQGITLLVSGHPDGIHLATAAIRWGYRVVTGSSTRRGIAGLRGVVRALRAGCEAALAPDGPRGPAQVVKPGTVAAARLGGAAIVPVAVRASAAWHARSWDRFLIPQPFARVRIVYGPPLVVDPETDPHSEGPARLRRALAAAAQAARA